MHFECCVSCRISDSRIICTSGEVEALAEPGAVVVFIDNAVVSNSSVQFQFRDDPVFSSVTPNTVIPAYV